MDAVSPCGGGDIGAPVKEEPRGAAALQEILLETLCEVEHLAGGQRLLAQLHHIDTFGGPAPEGGTRHFATAGWISGDTREIRDGVAEH